MTAAGFCLLVLLTRSSGVSSILFDLLNTLGPHYPACVCAPPPCAASAAASASSVSQSSFAGPVGPVGPVGPYGGGYYGGGGYGGPPMYPVRGPYRHRRRRQTLVRAAHDEQCSSDTIGDIIEQAMTPSLMESRERIKKSLLTHYGRENVVLCSSNRIAFTVTDGAEYCERIREGISCYAFVF
ncbi:hypothetical protein Y032_0461g1884 [Ancylostoma ceylanicum]|nr:hypothetical protein Y032_0461g1884 [Ancylostoma ceylanicum]